MESDEKGRIDQEEMNKDAANHNSAHAWSNLTGTSLNLAGPCYSMPSSRGDFMGDGAYSSSALMVDSFGRELWDRASDPSLENLGCCEVSGHSHNNSSLSETSGIRRIGTAAFRTNVGWNPRSPMLNSALYAPNALNIPPGSFCLPQFPSDSGFIERAARFSCFNGGNFTSLPNPSAIFPSAGCYPVGPGLLAAPSEIFRSNFMKLGSNLNVESTEDVDMLASKQDTFQGCPQKNSLKSESETVMRCDDGTEQAAGLSSNDSDGGNYSGNHGGQADTSIADSAGGEDSLKEVSIGKRKRSSVMEAGSNKANVAVGIMKNDSEYQKKVEQSPSAGPSKGTGKNNKQETPTSDPLKGDYIHIRARRGQATNSHSLAERVRREKISERMKLLQDLVPGCSKVTGKAVMLDEIINYVQSLQRQVEFLSMKLATVNPRLDGNIERLLAKEQRAGPSTLGTSPEIQMGYHQMNIVPPGLVPPDALGRAILGVQTAPLSAGVREPQVPHSWEDELHNVVHMGFSCNIAAPRGQESLPPDNMKVEL
ncbi:hypothetical protein MLD38_011460 [Melastoma candidum]|uniref:Uncharacterized protein n=1 Tax=Melastoma candidum TaxID=119954 RepID=A0ACB9R3P5_9MYRT|nr:hypothetical protein MLD38_011460 [Melastoma candidum]